MYSFFDPKTCIINELLWSNFSVTLGLAGEINPKTLLVMCVDWLGHAIWFLKKLSHPIAQAITHKENVPFLSTLKYKRQKQGTTRVSLLKEIEQDCCLAVKSCFWVPRLRSFKTWIYVYLFGKKNCAVHELISFYKVPNFPFSWEFALFSDLNFNKGSI